MISSKWIVWRCRYNLSKEKWGLDPTGKIIDDFMMNVRIVSDHTEEICERDHVGRSGEGSNHQCHCHLLRTSPEFC